MSDVEVETQASFRRFAADISERGKRTTNST